MQGQGAVVTGGAKGIGRATAIRFLAEGGHLAVIDREAEDSEFALTLRAEVGDDANRLVYIAADVMMGGGSAAEMAWNVLVPSLGAAIGLRVLAWLVAPRASMNRRREQMQQMLRARR